MNKKWLPIILIVLLAAAVFAIKRWQGSGESPAKTNSSSAGTEKVDRDRGFDRRISYLSYSKHARCRMECREISQSEVEQIMQQGKINYNKSDLKNSRCPRYALEGTTNDNQRVRIVYAQCNESTTVVTVIDLETDWTCDCPGDDNGSTNKNRN